MCTCWFGKAKEAGCGAEINRDIIKIDKLRIKDRMSVLVLVQHSKKKIYGRSVSVGDDG